MKIIVFFKISNNCNGNHQSQLYPTIILSMKQMSIKCMKIHKMIQNKTNYKDVTSIYVDFFYFGALVQWYRMASMAKTKAIKYLIVYVCIFFAIHIYPLQFGKKCNTHEKVFNSFASETKVIEPIEILIDYRPVQHLKMTV